MVTDKNYKHNLPAFLEQYKEYGGLGVSWRVCPSAIALCCKWYSALGLTFLLYLFSLSPFKTHLQPENRKPEE